MKKIFALATLALATSFASAEPLGYPGSTWGALVFPAGLAGGEEHNILLSGKVEQGVDWFRVSEKWTFNTYVSVNYSIDQKQIGYNNKVVPALGLKFSRAFDNGVLDLGIQAVRENRFRDHQTNSGVQGYASWWYGWNLKK